MRWQLLIYGHSCGQTLQTSPGGSLADWIIDLGPGAGLDGGRIVFEGTPAEFVAACRTLTGEHLAAYVGPVSP